MFWQHTCEVKKFPFELKKVCSIRSRASSLNTHLRATNPRFLKVIKLGAQQALKILAFQLLHLLLWWLISRNFKLNNQKSIHGSEREEMEKPFQKTQWLVQHHGRGITTKNLTEQCPATSADRLCPLPAFSSSLLQMPQLSKSREKTFLTILPSSLCLLA